MSLIVHSRTKAQTENTYAILLTFSNFGIYSILTENLDFSHSVTVFFILGGCLQIVLFGNLQSQFISLFELQGIMELTGMIYW